MGEEFSGSRPGLGLKRPGGPNDGLSDDCKLYVGSLPAGFSDSQLKSMFEPFGTVTHAIVMQDQTTGQSRGFGFVHFQEASNALSAKQGMNGKQVDGRSLIVKLRSEPPGVGGAPKGPLPGVVDESKLYVGFLPYTVTDDQLKGLFSAYAPVVEARIVTDRTTGQSKGFGFVTMASAEGAQTAKLGLDGYTLPEGKRITVRVAGMKPEATSNPAFNRVGSGVGAGSFSSPYGGPRPVGYGTPGGYGAGYGAPPPPGGYGGVYGGHLHLRTGLTATGKEGTGVRGTAVQQPTGGMERSMGLRVTEQRLTHMVPGPKPMPGMITASTGRSKHMARSSPLYLQISPLYRQGWLLRPRRLRRRHRRHPLLLRTSSAM